MSLLIRQQLAKVAARLRTEVGEAKAALQPPNPALDKALLRAVAEKLKRNMVLVQQQVDKWTHIMSALSGNDLATEEERCANFLVGGESPVDILDAATDVLTQVNLAVGRLDYPAGRCHLSATRGKGKSRDWWFYGTSGFTASLPLPKGFCPSDVPKRVSKALLPGMEPKPLQHEDAADEKQAAGESNYSSKALPPGEPKPQQQEDAAADEIQAVDESDYSLKAVSQQQPQKDSNRSLNQKGPEKRRDSQHPMETIDEAEERNKTQLPLEAVDQPPPQSAAGPSLNQKVLKPRRAPRHPQIPSLATYPLPNLDAPPASSDARGMASPKHKHNLRPGWPDPPWPPLGLILALATMSDSASSALIICWKRLLPQFSLLLFTISFGFFIGMFLIILFRICGLLYTCFFKVRAGHRPRIEFLNRWRRAAIAQNVRWYRRRPSSPHIQEMEEDDAMPQLETKPLRHRKKREWPLKLMRPLHQLKPKHLPKIRALHELSVRQD